ncbi:hypothetical protein GB882_11555, partial [Georgenia ruanii]|nr:hypothetical protein [Georgenia ruanii]
VTPRAGHSPLHLLGHGAETYTVEVMGLEGFHKRGLVETTSTGRMWRLEADEGTYLRGTNLAPAPLMYWGAGLHADILTRVAAAARERGVTLTSLSGTVRQGFAATGSFVRAQAVAKVFDLRIDVAVDGAATPAELDALVAHAIATSPAVAAVATAREGRFGLHSNGRPTAVHGIPALHGAPAVDPLRKYAEVPEPTDEQLGDVVGFEPGHPDRTHVVTDDSDGAVEFHVEARGKLDPRLGTVRTTVGFPEVTGDRWSLLSDPADTVAPSPLAYFSIGTAFCYHTQLCRYVAVRRLPLERARLTQVSRFEIDRTRATADPLATHVFLNGRCEDAQTTALMTLAANICYAHRALASNVEVSFGVDATARVH